MKTILMAASALSLIAAPAFAQDASSTVNIAGTVAEQCGEGNHISGYDVNNDWAQGDITGIDMDNGVGQFEGYTSGQRSFVSCGAMLILLCTSTTSLVFGIGARWTPHVP